MQQSHTNFAGEAYEERHVVDAPAVRTLRRLEDRAVSIGASDLHFEPVHNGGRVRARVDGMLVDLEEIDAAIFVPLISRVKLLAGMDIADRRQPQDGRYTIDAGGRVFDARASSMPSINGEKVVVRLLETEARVAQLDRLGMGPRLLERYRRMIEAPYGFVIVTGPTGSGKTTTLYGSLLEIRARDRSICTVEDPVEMRLDGVTQVNVNQRAGLTFATVIRSFLRQDPNVIMVGEMRDAETAAVAIRAALSGQLVLTTLHSNDAPRAIERLIDLGIDRYAIAAAVHGILSQRLVRRLCLKCRRPDPSRVGTYLEGGCDDCGGSGYAGRVGIFELMEIDDPLREAISNGASIVVVRNLATERGYIPLFSGGMTLVSAGETSVAELQRVVAWPT